MGFGPDGFAKPDLEAFDFESTPACCPEVSKFVDKNDDVKDQNNDENNEDGCKDIRRNDESVERREGAM